MDCSDTTHTPPWRLPERERDRKRDRWKRDKGEREQKETEGNEERGRVWTHHSMVHVLLWCSGEHIELETPARNQGQTESETKRQRQTAMTWKQENGFVFGSLVPLGERGLTPKELLLLWSKQSLTEAFNLLLGHL